MQGQQQPMQIAANPALQSLLDSLPHTDVPLKVVTAQINGSNPPQSRMMIICPDHNQAMCAECKVNFNELNYMHQFMQGAPPEAIPPPPNVQPPPQRAEMIKNAKEQGNVGVVSIWLTSRRLSRQAIIHKLLHITLGRQIWHYQDRPGS
jgi:translocation protein SEC72